MWLQALPWPVGEADPTGVAPPGVDLECIRQASADQFADTDANPRGITVAYREELIFEQYQAGVVDKTSRLIGWSATKSVVNALIGVVAGEGDIDVMGRAPVPEWQGDPRSEITTDEMLSMTSGTPWGFDPLTTTPCLFDSNGDCAGFCTDPESFPLETPPGQVYEVRFLLKNLHFPLKNRDFLIKNLHFYVKSVQLRVLVHPLSHSQPGARRPADDELRVAEAQVL